MNKLKEDIEKLIEPYVVNIVNPIEKGVMQMTLRAGIQEGIKYMLKNDVKALIKNLKSTIISQKNRDRMHRVDQSTLAGVVVLISQNSERELKIFTDKYGDL